MNTFETKPDTTPVQPNPDRELTPQPGERKRRRTFTQPTFAIAAVVTCLLLATSTQAQTERTTTTGTQQQTDRTTTSTQQPQTASGGWVMFHDSIGTSMNISAERMTQLRELDKRYQTEYTGLGKDPMNNPGYRTLTDRRNADIRRVMGDDGYNRWNTRYNAPTTGSMNDTNKSGTDTRNGTDNKNMDRTTKQ